MSYYSISLGSHFGASLSASASAVNSSVPGLFPVAVGGRPYLVNLDPQFSLGIRFSRDSLPLLRTQADNARTSGESSVSPENFWRRSIDSWHHGAGQSHYDRDDSDPYRFNTSVGVDPWTFGELSLLNDVAVKKTTSNTNAKMVVAGSYVFWLDNTDVKYSLLSGSTWGSTTTLTGGPGVAFTGIATNGRFVWVSAGASGVYQIDVTSPGSMSQLAYMYSSRTCTGVWFNKGRLFAAQNDGFLNEINSVSGNYLATTFTATANPVLVDLSSATNIANKIPNWVWTSSDALGNYHYFAGYYGDKSSVYKTTISANNALKLDPGSIALDMPDGEYVTCLYSYLGYMFIGTSRGLRMAEQDSGGNLVLGALIATSGSVLCAEGQDRFVWFGWSNNTDSGFSGLGRIDLTVFNKPLQPAYATDLMSSTTGNVSSVVTTSDNRRAFMVVGSGIYAETATPVASGFATSGQITHGITDEKVAVFQKVRHSALTSTDSVAVYNSIDGDSYVQLGSSNTIGSLQSSDFYVGKRNTFIETKLVINGTCNLAGFLMRSYPSPRRLTRFTVPVLLYDSVNALNQRDYPLDVGVEYDALTKLHSDQTIVAYQEGESTYSVVVDDFSWIPEKYSTKSRRFQGTLVLVLRQIA